MAATILFVSSLFWFWYLTFSLPVEYKSKLQVTASVIVSTPVLKGPSFNLASEGVTGSNTETKLHRYKRDFINDGKCPDGYIRCGTKCLTPEK